MQIQRYILLGIWKISILFIPYIIKKKTLFQYTQIAFTFLN